MKAYPDSIMGRALVAVLAGLLVSHLVALALYVADRQQALAESGGRQIAERIALLVRQAEEGGAKPPRMRALASPMHGRGVRAEIGPRPLAMEAGGERDWSTRMVAEALLELLEGKSGDDIHVVRLPFDVVAAGFGFGPAGSWGGRHHGPEPRDAGHPPVLLASVHLAGGEWLTVGSVLWGFKPFWSAGFFVPLVAMTVVVLGLSAWAVRRAAAPLGLFARAAERLGIDMDALPLPEDGPAEVRRAAHAFNTMQRRLQELVHGRTRMLAAISHDLRTPITRLRLRAELIEGEEDRAKTLADLDGMEAMIASTLAFARDEAAREERTQLDLAALLQSLCDDAADAGRPAFYRGPDHCPFAGRPTALKRALANLIGNALAYGGRAEVGLVTTRQAVVVTVDDAGPGLPETELTRVFQPFYRVEASRSRETGGVGLGLAVVAAVVRAHGGEVVLTNRPEGGLRASVTLPSSPPGAAALGGEQVQGLDPH